MVDISVRKKPIPKKVTKINPEDNLKVTDGPEDGLGVESESPRKCSKEVNMTNENDDFLYVPHVSKENIENILSRFIDVSVNDIDLYRRSLVHRSIQTYVRRKDSKDGIMSYLMGSNERLEFVGDATIGLIVAEYLFKKYPNKDEGELTKIRTRIVKSSSLSYFAEKIGLKGKILMSNQVINLNGLENRRFLEDAFEAFVGALYLDQGLDVAKRFVIGVVDTYFDERKMLRDENYKDILSRFAQSQSIELPVYSVIKEEGKPHEREFTVSVELFGKRQGKGKAKLKKEAEQMAAKDAIKRLNVER